MTNSYMIYRIDDDYTLKKSATMTYINKIALFICIKNNQFTQSALFYNIHTHRNKIFDDILVW